MKPQTPLKKALLQFTALGAAIGFSATAFAQATLTDIGAAPPAVGPNDIAQLTRSGSFPPSKPDGLNYYWDNGSPPGQTFTTGSNPGGYTLTSLALLTAGDGSGYNNANTYVLRIYSVAGATATSVASYTFPGFILNAQGDWIQWKGLSTYLTPNTQYAYSFGRSGGSGWEAMGCVSTNPYAGGEIVLVPTGGGTMTFGSSHLWDAAFVAGLTTAAQPPSFATLPQSLVLYSGQTATFSVTAGGTPPFTYQWQRNGGNLSDGGKFAGASTATLTITGVSASEADFYNVIVSNAAGPTNSVAVTNASLSVLPAPAAGSFAESVMTNHPLAYWRFGEASGSAVAYDYAGGLNGAYLSAVTLGVNGPQPPDELGFEIGNTSFEPTGLDQTWVTIPALNLNTNAATFVAWVNPNADQQDWAGILTSRHNGTQAGFNFTSTKNELAYTWNNNTTWQYHTGLIVSNNVWTMVALVVSPTNATFYACDTNSGIRTAVIVLTNNAEIFGGPGTIGVDDNFGAGRAMNGFVDEVAVFKYSLSPAQITALYAAGRAAGVLAPAISQNPVPQSLYPGRTAQFTVVASGTSPVYRWRKGGFNMTDGGNILGSSTPALTVSNVQAGDAADYDVVVTNSAGAVTSSIASLTLTAPTGAGYEAAVIAAAPTAYWRLNEPYGSANAFDYYGGFTATVGALAALGQPGPVNPPFPGFEASNTGAQLTYATLGSWVAAPPLNLNTNTVTIGAWIYPIGAQTNYTAIVFQRQGLTVAGLTYGAGGTNLAYNWNNEAGAYNWQSGLRVPENQWSFVALVVEPAKATLYLFNAGGVSSAVNVHSHVVQPFAGTTYIGHDVGDPTGERIFNGVIDEVSIWNRSLTGEQIAGLYSAASGMSVPPSISLQPASQATYAGLNVQFSSTAVGSAPLAYRWLKNGAPVSDGGTLSGTATPALSITGPTASDAGAYSLRVTNTSGSVTSQVATLTVLPTSARIVWSAPVPVTTVAATLTQSGNIVGGATFGGAETAVTIPGDGTVTFKTDGSVATVTGNGTGSGALGLFTTGDANFNSVLDRFSYDGGPKTITVTNLVAGHLYSVQLFGLDNRNTAFMSRRAFFRDPYDTNDFSATFYMSNNVYVIGTFTAVTNRQLIVEVLPGTDGGTDVGNGNLNALVVRDMSPAPTITGQPTSLTRFAGAPASFTAMTLGTPPMYYQWQKGTGGIFANTGVPGTISFAVDTPVTLSLTAVSVGDAADYRLVVTNSSGSVTSQVATLTVLPVVPGSYAATAIGYGPLAYYRLNETGNAGTGTLVANDFVGGYNGLYGNAATNGVPGPSGTLFGGLEANNTAVETASGITNSWVSTPFGSLGANTVTFAMWIYPIGAQPNWAGLLITRGNGTEGGLGYNDQGMLAYTWNDNSTWNYVSGLVIPSNTWSFAAMVIEPTQATLYLYNANGKTTATNILAHTADVFGGNWLIGSDGTGGDRVFNGVIDEVAVFTTALTPARIGQLYSSASGPPPVTVTIENLGGSVRLTWPQGTLLEAPSVNGPWTTNTATSPYTFTPSAGEKLYRVIVR